MKTRTLIAILLIAFLSIPALVYATQPARITAFEFDESPTPDATATEEPTWVPCAEDEYWDPYMDRCRRPEDDIQPTETPSWGVDIQATMDADPYDNDYQYLAMCWDYVDGGTRIVYYPCDSTPEPEQ